MRTVITAYACQLGAGSKARHGWDFPSCPLKRGREIHAVIRDVALEEYGTKSRVDAAIMQALHARLVGRKDTE